MLCFSVKRNSRDSSLVGMPEAARCDLHGCQVRNLAPLRTQLVLRTRKTL